MKYTGKTNEYFEIINLTAYTKQELDNPVDGLLSFIWFEEDGNQLTIDSKEYQFNKDQIVCLTPFHKVLIGEISKARLLRFNAPFYCILDHDSEVGCKGLLFFGSATLPILNPSKEDLDILSTVWKMILLEMNSKDNLQLEMLQMMLKRLLILSTRIYKGQENFQLLESGQSDIVRDFNFLVEQHFKEKHGVAEYASMLNKSPKTLSNLFKKLHERRSISFRVQRLGYKVEPRNERYLSFISREFLPTQ